MSVAMKSAATTGNSNCPVGDEFFYAFFKRRHNNLYFFDSADFFCVYIVTHRKII